MALTSIKVQDRRRLNARDGVGPNTPIDGEAALHIRAPSTVAGAASSGDGTYRVHAQADGHVLPHEVGVQPVPPLYVRDDGCKPPARWVPHKPLDAARGSHGAAARDATASSGAPAEPPFPLTRHAPCLQGGGSGRARAPLGTPGALAPRCVHLVPTGPQGPHPRVAGDAPPRW